MIINLTGRSFTRHRSHRWWRCLLAGWFGLLIGWPATGTSQELIPEAEWRRGYHGLNLIVQGMGLNIQPLEQWTQVPPEQRVLVVLGTVDGLPVDLGRLHRDGVSILVASDGPTDRNLTGLGIDIRRSAQAVANPRDYFQFDDCPIVRNLAKHPVFEGINELYCNQPGQIYSVRSPSPRPLARLPRMKSSRVTSVVAVTLADTAPGKFLCIADSSLLTNQMLLLGGNRQFAQQALNWLSDGLERKSVLILADRSSQAIVDPASIAVLTPPPSREQLINALKNLPPDMLLEFGNSVVGVVEDENMVNEFLNGTMDRIPPKAINRFLILLSFGLIAVFAVATFFWQKKLLRKTSSAVAVKHQRYFSRRKKHQHARERQLAARVLLNSLCLDYGNRRLDDWPMFPQGLDLGQAPQSSAIIEQMTDANQKLRQESAAYWTDKRLLELNSMVDFWRESLEPDDRNQETPTSQARANLQSASRTLDELGPA